MSTDIKYVDSYSPGCFIHVYAEFENTRIGFSTLGEKGVLAEKVGRNCFEEFASELDSGAVVDRYTGDQLLIYLALAGEGKIKVSKITNHMKTNIDVIEKFLDVKFIIKDNLIECR